MQENYSETKMTNEGRTNRQLDKYWLVFFSSIHISFLFDKTETAFLHSLWNSIFLQCILRFLNVLINNE